MHATVPLLSTFGGGVNAEYIDLCSLDCLFVCLCINTILSCSSAQSIHCSSSICFLPFFSPSSLLLPLHLLVLGLLCANVIQHSVISIIRGGGVVT